MKKTAANNPYSIASKAKPAKKSALSLSQAAKIRTVAKGSLNAGC